MSRVNFLLDRYDIHISTDRPIYNLDEWVLIRAVVLNGITNHPLPDQFKPQFTVAISSPKGDEVAKFTQVPIQNSVVVGSWKVTNEAPGGDYKIRVSVEESTSDMVFAAAERSFEVREFFAPKLKLQAEFVKKGLGAGDTATAVLNAVRAEGGIPVGAKVTATARIDGAEAWRGETTLDEKGDCRVTFKLPDDIKAGEGTLTFTVQDGGNVESIGKTIPILLATIKVNFYPESGQLINGIESGLYFECFQTNGDPADVKGQLLSIASTTARASTFSTAATIENLEQFTRVCELESSHEGRGKVVFTPEKHNTYFMHVSTPGGIRNLIKLPRETCKVHKRGAIIRSNKDTYQRGEPVELTVISNETDDYTLKLYKRDFELASAPVKSKGTRVITFYPPAAAGEGVLRATLFKKSTPVAERLIFRHLARQIKVKITPNKESFKPNQKLEVKVTTTNEFDEPVKAVIGVTVADDAILEMVEKRKKAPRLPEMVLLESEVNELWDSSVYFKEEPKSHQAIDMLLGTQGWRRFLFFKSEPEMVTFLKENDAAERVLVSTENSLKGVRVAPPPPTPSYNPYYGGPPPSPGGGPPGMGRGSGPVLSGAPKRVSVPSGAVKQSSLIADIQRGSNLSAKSKETKSASPRSESPRVSSSVPPPPAPSAPSAQSAPSPRLSSISVAPSSSMVSRSMAPPMAPSMPSAGAMPPRPPGLYVGGPPPPPGPYGGPPRPPMPVISPRPSVGDNEEISFVNVNGGTKYVVREYKHKKSTTRNKTTRTDFTKTLYWHGGLVTNDSGEATVAFTLSESITSFRFMVDAFNRNNGFGVNDYLIESKEPFSSDVRVPIEVTESDEMLLPIVLVNNTKKKFSDAKVSIDVDPALKVDSKKAAEFKAIKLNGNERVRKLLKITASEPGHAFVKLEAKSGSGHLDKIERRMRVMPLGFPQQVNSSGSVAHDGELSFDFEIPSKISKNSITASLSFFPSPAGNFESICDRLCQTPGGCFEQVGSTMFPLILAAQWYANKGDLNKLGEFTPKIKVGYDKIKGYEVRGGGFEWYGGTPAHTALTAFGVIMLQETMPVYDIDKGLLDRSVQWLLDQRDGKGEFKQAYGKYAWSSPPKDAAHAYIMWAITETNVTVGSLEKELQHLNKLAEQGQSYVVSLAAIVNHRLKQKEHAKKLADKLVSLQDKQGTVTNPGNTIVYSGNAAVESTALSMIAWMRIDPSAYRSNIEAAKKWLGGQLSPYGYGNTQATSLTLKAINMYNTDLGSTANSPGILSVHFNDKLVQEVTLKEDSSEAIHVPFTDVKIGSGKHKLRVKLTKGSLPYQFTVNYNALTPNSATDCAVKLEAKLSKKAVNEGEGCEVMVKVTNVTKEDLPMVLAIIGLPGGFEPRHEQLKDLVKKEKIDFYEVIGRNIALYWRGFDKAGVAEFPVDVVATVPGSYTGPASRAFLYYTPEKQHWIDGLTGEIVPK